VENLSLFPEEPPRLASTLDGLARRKVWIGTSSWKYPGWLGQIYTRERYLTRGRFSQKKFEQECLAEYARTFPIVCGDFSFYQFPSPANLHQLMDATPARFRFAFKVPEFITVKRFPVHGRYGGRAGLANESFLDADLLERMLLEPLSAFGDRTAVLIFEFGTFSKDDFRAVDEFCALLDAFLARLPRQVRYAVEIRNREYLQPAYFDCLRAHGVPHVFNAWTRMPELGEQMRLPGSRTAGFSVVRALLRAGRAYEQAVKQFAPYEKIQDPNPEARNAIRALIEESLSAGRATYVFVNNRLEGNAPATIEAIAGA
jgi:uncharacterized protein YecE (DUF72 family)